MTFSIAGYCAETGQIGYALATSSIAAGGRVAFAHWGVGVVLTQARTDPRLGPQGLALLRDGRSAAETVASLVASTPERDWRQLAVLDKDGHGAFHTGQRVSTPADALVAAHCVAAGNWVAEETVIAAMIAGFELDPFLPLAERLLRAIEDAVAAGGELDPLRSAALGVHGRNGFAMVDLRIDRSERPVADLRAAWKEWEPIMHGYIERALSPATAPATEELEGHAKG
ncbi:DUF1028 domain-containing protein [Nisaea sp.]|uniref:DUF1028 domain-containing protein n=1 Tax=Nisaea sp. TaxID=2024842 RepID=UPI003B5208A5